MQAIFAVYAKFLKFFKTSGKKSDNFDPSSEALLTKWGNVPQLNVVHATKKTQETIKVQPYV